MHSPAFVWGAALGLLNHYFFDKYEPSTANIALLVLPVQPVALLLLLGEPFSRLFYTIYVVFLGNLTLSIVVYRLSPFHPLAQYPGPAIAKVTKLWSFWKTAQGYKYLWHKELHDQYRPYVRTDYESGRHKDTPPAIVCLSGEAHTAKRRVWNHAMTSACILEYEPLIVKRASQLISCLREQPSSIDLVHWLDLFAFGGGFEMLRDGRDLDRVGERIRGFTKASYLIGQLPWILGILHLFLQVAREIQQFNDFGQSLAIQRMKNGAVGTMDLWYHLADEGDLEKEKPTLKTSAADVVAVVAASDTTTSALNSPAWFLLSNPDHYRCAQQEVDTVFVDGDDFFDVSKHISYRHAFASFLVLVTLIFLWFTAPLRMLQIFRAEDGQVFQVDAGIRDIERVGSLELFLRQETEIAQDSVYLPDGRRLTNSNIRELNGTQTPSIYVFNKYYLDLPVDDVPRELRVDAVLHVQPPIEVFNACSMPFQNGIAATRPFDPRNLARRTCGPLSHKEFISHILTTMHSQHAALRIASTRLDMHVFAVVDTFESVVTSSRRELEKQASLLAGLEADPDIIGRVRIHTEFVSPAVRKAIESGEKPRTLGDYVSN
ncbi:cytochrome P450, partial [Mycena sanguinolenta]